MQSFKEWLSESNTVKLTRATIEEIKNLYIASNTHKLTRENGIGWFSNTYNTSGWSIHTLTPSEKKEFGSVGVYRSLSDKGTTSVLKIDPIKGTYAFIDNAYYEENDKVKFEPMTKYKKLVIDNKPNSVDAFGLKGITVTY